MGGLQKMGTSVCFGVGLLRFVEQVGGGGCRAITTEFRLEKQAFVQAGQFAARQKKSPVVLKTRIRQLS